MLLQPSTLSLLFPSCFRARSDLCRLLLSVRPFVRIISVRYDAHVLTSPRRPWRAPQRGRRCHLRCSPAGSRAPGSASAAHPQTDQEENYYKRWALIFFRRGRCGSRIEFSMIILVAGLKEHWGRRSSLLVSGISFILTLYKTCFKFYVYIVYSWVGSCDSKLW